MSSRVRIAFATCTSQEDALKQAQRRFAAIADVRAYLSPLDGVDEILDDLVADEPDVIVAEPHRVEAIRSRVPTPIVPFEFTPEAILTRIDRASQKTDAIAVLPLVGTVSPAVVRILKRSGSAVHFLPWESYPHLRDLIVRCRRMGVEAVIGGKRPVDYGSAEKLHGFCLYDEEGESDGVISHLVLRAAGQCAARITGRMEELVAFGLILDKISQGAIDHRDTVLYVDRCGMVTAVYGPHAHANGGPRLSSDDRNSVAVPTGVPFVELLNASARELGTDNGATDRPLQLDVYPLAEAGCEGYVVVVKGTPRPGEVVNGAAAAASRSDPRLETLLQRADALLQRTEAVLQVGRARQGPRRLLGSLRRRMFLVDWSRVRFFELRSGLVYASTITGESYATNYTLADVMARVDQRDFFRIHRNVIVNLNYVTEVERYGQGQLRLVLDGPDTPAFVVSRPASAALRKLLKY